MPATAQELSGLAQLGPSKLYAYSESAWTQLGPFPLGLYEFQVEGAQTLISKQGDNTVGAGATDATSWLYDVGSFERFRVNSTSDAYFAVKRAVGSGSINLRVRVRQALGVTLP